MQDWFNMCKNFLKRIVDMIFSLVLIIVLSPILIMTYFLVKKKLGSPAVFKQDRPGLRGQIFTMYKFRSMTDARDKSGNLLADDVRLTPFGKLLRASSLDELPELFNILKGDMSFVGPRPLLVRYLDRYTKQQARRHEVRPGLTGWAQVNGRNAISWEEKFELDVWYVEHWNLWIDFKIMCLTVLKVFRRDGISAADHATMEEFWGSDGKHE